MRNILNKFGIPITIGVVVLAVIVLVAGRSCNAPTRSVENTNLAFYFDEATNKESTGQAGELPPLLGNGGQPTVVGEVKYTTDNGKTSQPLYYYKYTDAAQAELKSLPDDPMNDMKRADLLEKGKVVRLPAAGSPWVPANTDEGEKITRFPEDTANARVVLPRR